MFLKIGIVITKNQEQFNVNECSLLFLTFVCCVHFDIFQDCFKAWKQYNLFDLRKEIRLRSSIQLKSLNFSKKIIFRHNYWTCWNHIQIKFSVTVYCGAIYFPCGFQNRHMCSSLLKTCNSLHFNLLWSWLKKAIKKVCASQIL